MSEIVCHSSYDPDKNTFFLFIEGCVKDSRELKKLLDCTSQIAQCARDHRVWTVCDFSKAELPSVVYMKMLTRKLLELARKHSIAEVCCTGTSDIIAGVSIFMHFANKQVRIVKTVDEAYSWVAGQQLLHGVFPNEMPDHP